MMSFSQGCVMQLPSDKNGRFPHVTLEGIGINKARIKIRVIINSYEDLWTERIDSVGTGTNMIANNEDNEKLRLLAAGLWIPFDFGHPNLRYQNFLSRGRPSLKNFIESILLYDEIIIPTQDFLSLTLLVGQLGQQPIIELIEQGRLSFLRFNGMFAYYGDGQGLQAIRINKGEEGLPHSFCAPIDDVIDFALDARKDIKPDPLLKKCILDTTDEVLSKDILEPIRDETYRDILNSPYLQDAFAFKDLNLDQLSGIEPNQIRGYSELHFTSNCDDVDKLLSLAATNLELHLAQISKCFNISTFSPVGHSLKAKAERSFATDKTIDSFILLKENASIPDIGEGVLHAKVSIDELLKLSSSKNARQFRRWFHESIERDDTTITCEYIDLLHEIPMIQTLPIKILRFIVTGLLSVIPPPFGFFTGTSAGIIDGFLLDDLLDGTSPKYFIEDLRQLEL